MFAIEAKSINKKYQKNSNSRIVIDNITLSITKGQITSIIGKSGCGKSTLLSILGLLQPPDSGEIILEGIRCSGLSSSARSRIRREYIGFVFQDFALLDHFTLIDNIKLPLIYDGLGRKEIDQRAALIMSLFGIELLAKQYPHEVSGGEKQRAALARALVRAPKIILADEPTGNLDSVNAQFVFDCFREIVKETDTTIVVVTHDSVLATQADQVIGL